MESISILGVGVIVESEVAIRDCIVLLNKKITENQSNSIILWPYLVLIQIII